MRILTKLFGRNLHLVTFVLLVFNALAAIALVVVVTRPYIGDFVFPWEIAAVDNEVAPSDEQE